MRRSRSQKLALFFLALVCAYLGWRIHDRGLLRPVAARPPTEAATQSARTQPLALTSSAPAAVLSAPTTPRWVPVTTLAAGQEPAFRDADFTNRLRNTDAGMEALIRNDRAILLRNALIDTASDAPLEIPARLRSPVPPEAYVVQAEGLLTRAFQDRLTSLGAEIVSYVPNNALLVRSSPEVANEIAVTLGTAAVLPLEPYFKLTPGLLALALDDVPLPDGLRLILTIPEASSEVASLTQLGVREVFRERGPFGTLITVEAPPDSLVALAGIPEIHRVEPKRGVRFANDLTAFALGSTTTAENTNSFEDLTGAGVLINVNDSGIDASHPDLAGRVFTLPSEPQVLTDPAGHGSHVAGTIAGSGRQSGEVNPPPQGSVTDANFKGKAPEAWLYALPVDLLFGPASGDAWLQETAAQAPERFNSINDILISNNSWGYFGLDPFEYSSHSASYDAAVRDALPHMIGDQPILYVFSAGNEGSGGDNGIGGFADTIPAPGNAKNVVTVGALENFRSITNAIITDTNGATVQIGGFPVVPGWETNAGPYFTNEVLLPMTDTDWQVASYSSRGNVGIGIEGPVGRFKPDVVAEGSFVASVRSALWSIPPLPPEDDPFFPIAFLFNEVDAEILPWYRFESGTSMAAPAVSGLLAQLQQNFEYKVNQWPSASSYKALLINSADATSPGYIPSQETVINYAGWGKPNLQRALGRGFRENGRDVIGIEAFGLATGESATIELNVSLTNALDQPLKLALVWTDPPGDPLAGPKLVNDLDLIVSNTITGEIYWGNDFDSQTGFSRPHSTNEVATNGLPTLDRINNVERVVLPPPIGSNVVITVVGHRVNVNARRDYPDAIVQDFSLAFASGGDPAETNVIGELSFPSGANPIALAFTRPPTDIITNSFPLLNQRAGANSPLLGNTNGEFRQWHFYVFTNSPGVISANGLTRTNGTNVYFITYLTEPGGNLSRGRTNGPDIDLYVSRDPGFTNLVPAAVAGARKSTSRETFELIDFIGEELSEDNVFYVGVKSEDHQAGQFGIFGISTDELLMDANGNPTPIAVPLTPNIPDGTPANPGVGQWLAVSIGSRPILAVTAQVTTTHENFTDLLTQLSYNRRDVTLQNHTPPFGLAAGTNITVIYDDISPGSFTNVLPSDGPGSLRDYLGAVPSGVWFLNQVDNALGYDGINVNFRLGIRPDFDASQFVRICIPPNGFEFDIVPVLPSSSLLTVLLTNLVPELPLQVFIKYQEFPDLEDPFNNDKYGEIPGTGGWVTLGTRDVPPLQAGFYVVAIYNPHSVTVCADYRAWTENNLDASFTRTFTSDQLGTIPDEARRFSSITVDDTRRVASLDVGLRIDHPRISDLAVRLENPFGFSSVLFENRGGTTATNLGGSVVSTNTTAFQHVALTYEPPSRQASVFVNGRMVEQRVMPPDYVPVTSNQFFFGRDPILQFTNQVVILDDFGVWRRALRPEEVRDIYFRGVEGEPKQASDRNNGLVSLWPFDGSGVDLAGTNHAFLSPPFQVVPGQFTGGALQFRRPGLAWVTNALSLPASVGFTIEGWVAIPPDVTNVVIAGWGSATSPQFGPGLVSAGNLGVGSVTAVMTDLDGTSSYFSSPPDQFRFGVVVTNAVFATFSENTNRANAMIKFAIPPFTGQLESEQVLSVDDFEMVEAEPFSVGAVFRGWEVLENTVAVVEDPALAFDDSRKFLVLSNGVVRRTFDAVVGERYKIAFAGRLAPGETNVINPVVALDGVEVTPPPLLLNTNFWNTNLVFEIRATKPTVVLEFDNRSTPVGSPGMLVDDVTFLQSEGRVSYLAEEKLDGLLGPGLGTWTLELNDTRTPFVGELLSWELTMTFAPESLPATRLTNGIPFTTNVAGATPQYFYIDVPLEVEATTNILQSLDGGSLVLWYNPLGVPAQGLLEEDFMLMPPTVGDGIFARTLDTNVPPVLVPGQRYYLSVENVNNSQNNQFVIQVDFGLKITPLTNNIPFDATNANNGLFDYYSFEVSTNGLGVSFVLTNLSDNLDLVVRKGPQLPSRTQYDYASTNLGTIPEVINIDQSSQPVPLSPGLWYLGVYSASTTPLQPVTYTILASEVQGTVVALTNGIPYDGTLTNETGISYFYLDINELPLTATFTLSNLTGNANLFLKRDLPLPSPGNFDYASTNAGLAEESITIIPGSLPVGLTPGRWYLAVVAVDDLPIDFTVTATYIPNTFTIIPLEDSVPFPYFDAPPTNSLFFSFDVPEDIGAVLFEIYGLTGEADLVVSRGVLPPYAAPDNRFTAPNPGPASERISVRTNTVPVLSGPWFLEVRVNSEDVIDFTVRAATQQDGLLISGEPLNVDFQVGPPPFLVLDTIPGERYSIQTTTNLFTPPPWTELSLVVATTDSLVFELPIPDPEPDTQFYRVVQVPQP